MEFTVTEKKLNCRESTMAPFVELKCPHCQQKVSFPMALLSSCTAIFCPFCHTRFDAGEIKEMIGRMK